MNRKSRILAIKQVLQGKALPEVFQPTKKGVLFFFYKGNDQYEHEGKLLSEEEMTAVKNCSHKVIFKNYSKLLDEQKAEVEQA